MNTLDVTKQPQHYKNIYPVLIPIQTSTQYLSKTNIYKRKQF